MSFTQKSPVRGLRAGLLAVGAAATVAVAGCSTQAPSPPAVAPTPASTSPSTAASTPSAGTTGTATYQLHMDFFSHESKISPVIDPQVFLAAPAAPAGTGPQNIKHVAGIAPTPKAGDASTPLLAADGSTLTITRGEWEKAAGTVAASCTNGSEQAISHLTGLIPGGSYSTFVVHLDVQGAGRFTPWGDAQGSTNNFTADATGTASPTNTVPGCLTNRAAVVIIWHSDGHPHGPTPGELGVSWHNSLITPLP